MEQSNKYYWIKLKTDFFNSDQIDFLMAQENGCKYVVLYQMLCLKTANNGGEMSSKIGEIIIPYDVNKISRDTKYFDIDTVRIALELFKQLGLVYVQENNILRIANFDRVVGSESASREAIKKREQRLKKKSIEYSGDNVGDISGDTLGTNCPIDNRYKSIDIRDKNIELDIEKEKKKNSKEKISDEEKKQVKKLIEDNYSHNSELFEAFNEFYKMRDKIKKDSNTAYITRRLINFLKSYNDNEKLEIINQSIINGWKGLFPLKKNNQYNNSNNKIPTIAGTGYESNSYNFEIPRDDEETNKYANMSEDEINF